jgi:aryl sulfotransferase
VGPPIERPPTDVREYFRDWLARDGHPFWPFWENVRSWWAIRRLPNVALFHFEELKRGLPGQLRRMATFLGVAVDEGRWPSIVEHCSFDWMKRNADRVAPLGGSLWDGGGASFIHRGTNGRWRDVLSADESAAYEARAVEELGAECARWLATGEEPG